MPFYDTTQLYQLIKDSNDVTEIDKYGGTELYDLVDDLQSMGSTSFSHKDQYTPPLIAG